LSRALTASLVLTTPFFGPAAGIENAISFILTGTLIQNFKFIDLEPGDSPQTVNAYMELLVSGTR
jgi:hypothetical protein